MPFSPLIRSNFMGHGKHSTIRYFSLLKLQQMSQFFLPACLDSQKLYNLGKLQIRCKNCQCVNINDAFTQLIDNFNTYRSNFTLSTRPFMKLQSLPKANAKRVYDSHGSFGNRLSAKAILKLFGDPPIAK